MPLDSGLKKQLAQALEVTDDQGMRGPRRLDDARRLWRRIERLIKMDLAAEPDLDALELACYALQLPLRDARPLSGKLGRTNLKERTEQSAELLITTIGEKADEALLDRATRLLHEVPHWPPMLEDARLLADAINLEDFGVVGLLNQMIVLTRQGDGILQLNEGCEKREQYGYWEARLKDGFHFEPARQIARRRLAKARQVASMLAEELKEDQA